MPPVFEDHAAHADAVFRAAVAAADPARCVSEAVRRNPPPETEPVWVVAMGKAAGAMFEGFRAATGRRHEAVMVVPDGSPAQAWALRADHPLPTVRSVEAGGAVRDFVQRQARAAAVGGHGGFVVLISGGASALVSLPVPAIPLARYRELTDALLRSGEPIGAINCVRKHCEQLKGGRLAALAAPAWVRAYILSDVIGDDPSDIASGPVSPDASTCEDAHRIVSRAAPGAVEVLAHLAAGRRGEVPETPKPGDPVFESVRPEIVGSNRMGLAAAAAAARGLGFEVIHSHEGETGDAAEAGRALARRAVEAASRSGGPAFVGLGGETTVRVGAGLGMGGRCQELALAAALEVSGRPGIAIGAFATDGTDGPLGPDGSVPAGAIVTGDTADACRRAGVDPGIALANHASRAALGAAGSLVYSDPTGTNINDIAFALVYSR